MSYGQTRVIGNWQPEQLSREYIKKHILLVVRDLIGDFQAQYRTVRDPLADSTNISTVSQFHSDGNKSYYFIVWSNVHPTEVKFKDDTMLEARDGDIILINNLEVVHKRPIVYATNRWFARLSYVEPGEFTGEIENSV